MQTLTKLSTSPIEPVSLNDMYDWLRQDAGADDIIIGTNITAARIWAEGFQRTSMVSEQFQLTLDHFPFFRMSAFGAGTYDGFEALWELPNLFHPSAAPFAIELPRGPLVSIDSFTYKDTTGTVQTLDSTGYQVVTGDDVPPRLYPPDQTFWPVTEIDPKAVVITFTAGYTAGTLPANTVAAIKILAAAFYADRSGQQPIPPLAKTLLYMNRQFEFYAGTKRD